MLAAALIALAGAGYHADLTGTLTLSDRSEVRVRTFEGETQPGVDAVTTPGIRLDLVGRRVSYSLGYSIGLTLQDLELGVEPQVFQTLSSRMSWLATRELRLSLSEDGTYGTYNYSALVPAPTTVSGPPATPATIQLLPGAETILYGSSRSTATAQLRATRALTLTLSPSYFVGGGLNEASRAVIPLETAPRLELAAGYTVDRRNSLFTTLAVTDSAFTAAACGPTAGAVATNAPVATCTPHNDLVEVSESWRIRLSRVDDVSLAIGATGTDSRGEATGDGTHVFPTASATWLHAVRDSASSGGTVSADVRVMPVIDVRYGTVDQRAQARLAWTWKTRRVTFSTDLGFTESLPPSEPEAATFVGGGVELLYSLDRSRRFDLGGGDRGAWQSQAPTPAFFTNVAYAVLIYHEPALRLWP